MSQEDVSQIAMLAAAEALVAAAAAGDLKQIRLSNGVVLRLKPIPPFVLERALAAIPEPKPPLWTNPEKGREEENPLDPDYLEARDRHAAARIMAISNVAMAVGTEIDSLPEGFPPPESAEWAEDLSAVGIEVPERPAKARYVAWLRYKALERPEDISTITGLPLLLGGISEEEVGQAMAGFRRDEAGGVDPDAPTRRDRPDEHRV